MKIEKIRAVILNHADKGDPLNLQLQLGIVAFINDERKTWSAITEMHQTTKDTMEAAIERVIETVIGKILVDLEIAKL